MSLAHHLLTQAYQNAWANHRLLAAILQLTDEEFVAARTSFFPSFKGTLNHILTVDWYYVDALEHALAGRPVNTGARAFFDPEEPYSTCPPLADEQRKVDRRLLALCRELRDDRLGLSVGVQRAKAVTFDRIDRLLAHLFEHQIHHRGQAHAMLSGTRVAPPQLDEFYCESDASFRAADFAELGFTEKRIWEDGDVQSGDRRPSSL